MNRSTTRVKTKTGAATVLYAGEKARLDWALIDMSFFSFRFFVRSVSFVLSFSREYLAVGAVVDSFLEAPLFDRVGPDPIDDDVGDGEK